MSEKQKELAFDVGSQLLAELEKQAAKVGLTAEELASKFIEVGIGESLSITKNTAQVEGIFSGDK